MSTFTEWIYLTLAIGAFVVNAGLILALIYRRWRDRRRDRK
jgi:hypothetical protein